MSKKSKVVNVQGAGDFKDLFVFEVEFENGDVGKIYRKTNDHNNCNVGDEKEYTLNDKGSIKIVQPAYSGGGGGGKKFDPDTAQKWIGNWEREGIILQNPDGTWRKAE